ncbi:hypothetical protein KIN20_001978 [Parelaphostrongylus tenuis]|uniref:Peptidase M20 dimerisation domain-containing protein n=1 Tax=Parelaphostrongylus tenuis TaxID=148309 RepID=A0AAD5QCQ1_PARTN|nr:hypothetical protein KIN20_001978 [Parelaphostrongylus tenuis]
MNLEQIFRDIDASYDHYKDILAEAVAIESVSGDPCRRPQTINMVHWTKERLEELGARCTLEDLGNQTIDGKEIPLPPVLLGQLGDDKKKKTVLVYGHLDVQPAAKEDGWNTEPFMLSESGNKLFGRGASDDKGPVLCWIHAVKMLQKHKVELPVNIKFCFEAMEESGSIGLEGVLEKNKKKFFADVDFTCISDSYWLGTTKPCLTNGLRGICSFKVEVTGLQQDLHSGVYGGVVHEPLADLLWVMSQLTSVDNRILIPGIYDDVAPMTVEESALYDKIDFNVQDLSVHGIEGAFSGIGEKTVIPSRVVGNFSIRTVPYMEPEKVNKMVIDFLNELWRRRGSPNIFRPHLGHHALPWVADPNDANFKAGERAMKLVHGVDPDYIREGCTIPITLTFQELTGKSVLLLPLGAADDMAHSQNEKINKTNYVDGVKTLLAYLVELGKA